MVFYQHFCFVVLVLMGLACAHWKSASAYGRNLNSFHTNNRYTSYPSTSHDADTHQRRPGHPFALSYPYQEDDHPSNLHGHSYRQGDDPARRSYARKDGEGYQAISLKKGSSGAMSFVDYAIVAVD
eukprot:TRINITY_DN14234_c0_g1_i1.p1 TRINITY_DN14234_c0_g1~~TRINITY_DN14234_c0_g1_i1.p1  ORF type:complete len:126 (+),score=19.68 TRINITY_DN14234_c0_g1_i1:101-478(+)